MSFPLVCFWLPTAWPAGPKGNTIDSPSNIHIHPTLNKYLYSRKGGTSILYNIRRHAWENWRIIHWAQCSPIDWIKCTVLPLQPVTCGKIIIKKKKKTGEYFAAECCPFLLLFLYGKIQTLLENIYTCFLHSLFFCWFCLSFYLFSFNLPRTLLTHHRWSMTFFFLALTRAAKKNKGRKWPFLGGIRPTPKKKSACNNNTKQEPRKKKIYNISNIGEKKGGKKLFWRGLMDFAPIHNIFRYTQIYSTSFGLPLSFIFRVYPTFYHRFLSLWYTPRHVLILREPPPYDPL